MKIIIATPLYPPDIAEPAPYAKELVSRLSDKHKIAVVLFGRLPETVDGVSFITVDKREMLPVRLWNYLKALWQETKQADVLYVLDGSSVELVVILLSLIRRVPVVLHCGDKDANDWVNNKFILRLIRKLVRARAAVEIKDLPPQRPEILPFQPEPIAQFSEYEKSWKNHLSHLLYSFEQAKQA